MKPRTLIAASIAVVGASAVLYQCTRPAPQTAHDVEVQEGAILYRTYCALCHGDQGQGYAADNANALANQLFLHSVSDDFLRVAIVRGHPGTSMAGYGQAMGGPLSDEEVSKLVAFLRSFQESEAPTLAAPRGGNPAAARALYTAECEDCHGLEGRGETALSLNNPVFLESANDAQIRYAIAMGRPDTPMPAFSDRLSASQIDDLVALIRSWARTVEDEGATIPVVPEVVISNPEGAQADLGDLREGRFVPAARVARAVEARQRLVLLDARATSDYARYHLPGAIPAPYYDMERIAERIPRDGTWVVAYCGCPHAASGHVMDYLREQGFENTAVLDEGVIVWKDEGYPIVTGPHPGTMDDAE